MFNEPGGQQFKSLSVILPVMDETYQLEKTVETIIAENANDVLELLIVVSVKTAKDSLAACQKLRDKYPQYIKIFQQELPFLGGAVRDSFAKAAGSHVLMMASDMETPPDRVKDFIKEAKANPNTIITASRWIKGGGFERYSYLKYILNYVFQKAFSLLYRNNLTDMTYGYRLFPTSLVKAIRWEELRHPFLFETLVKPLRLGIKVKEIPTVWKARAEGQSQNTFMRNFEYFRVGIKTLFYSKEQILK